MKKPDMKHSLTELARTQFEFSQLLLNQNKFKYLENSVKIENPIIILPGFLGHDFFYGMLKKILSYHCDNVSSWEQGFNLGLTEPVFKNTIEYILEVFKTTNKKPILIGHSLGGVYAKEIAKLSPDIIHSVYTMGTPILDSKGDMTQVKFLYNMFNPKNKEGNHTDFERNIINNYLDIPKVPFTSFYSKKDGVVHWEASVLPDLINLKNIEVESSHCGMIFNHAVLEILLKELFCNYE